MVPHGRVDSVPIVINRLAGSRGQSSSERLVRLFRSRGVAVEVLTAPPAGIESVVAAAVAAGHPRLLIAGGDGTLAAAASAIAGSGTVLVPVPTGTLNNFSRRLGIANPSDAAAALNFGTPRSVPVGVVDDRLFLNTATFGLYADVVRRREAWRPLLSKWPAAFLAFLDVLVRMRQFDAVIQIEGEYLRISTPLLWVGVGWGSFPRVVEAAERRTSPDLEIVILKPGTRRGAVALLARLIRHLLVGRRPIQDPALRVMHAKNLLIHASHPVGVTMDGEVLRAVSPIYVGLQEGALEVLIPDRARSADHEAPAR